MLRRLLNLNAFFNVINKSLKDLFNGLMEYT